MNNEELINSYWEQAVSGMNENTFKDADKWYDHVVNLPKKMQITYVIGILNKQVLNGGFHQYFLNSYGQFAYLTLDHLNTIKAYETASILEKALAEVNSRNYDIHEFRYNVFNQELARIAEFDDELCTALEQMDTRYYAAVQNMEQLWMNYLRA